MPQQPSKTQAVALLREVHINIFDLLEGLFDKTFPSVAELAWYSLEEDKIFPKKRAKSENLKAFLRKLGYYIRRGRRMD